MVADLRQEDLTNFLCLCVVSVPFCVAKSVVDDAEDVAPSLRVPLAQQHHLKGQEEAHEEVAVQYAGVEMEIGFNVNYILDVLNVIVDKSVKISVADANSSALVESEEDPESVFVVMPMRL